MNQAIKPVIYSSNQSKRRLQLFIFALFLLLVLIVNRWRAPKRTPVAFEFDKIVSSVEISGAEPLTVSPSKDGETELTSDPAKASVTITISKHNQPAPFKSTFSGATRKDETIRILQLMREADLLSLPQATKPAEDDPLVSFHVDTDGRIFDTEVRYSDLADRPPALILLKLIQVYSTSKK